MLHKLTPKDCLFITHMYPPMWKARLTAPMNLDSDPRCLSCFYLQSRNHLLSHLLGGHKVTGHFGVNDPVLLLPAHDDGLLPVGRAAHLLLLALRGQGSVRVGRDHRRNWKPKRGTDLPGDLGFLISPL